MVAGRVIAGLNLYGHLWKGRRTKERKRNRPRRDGGRNRMGE